MDGLLNVFLDEFNVTSEGNIWQIFPVGNTGLRVLQLSYCQLLHLLGSEHILHKITLCTLLCLTTQRPQMRKSKAELNQSSDSGQSNAIASGRPANTLNKGQDFVTKVLSGSCVMVKMKLLKYKFKCRVKEHIPTLCKCFM